MAEEDTLLDTFVDIDVRGQGESKAAIDAFVAAAKRAFGDLSSTQAATAKKGADASITAANAASAAIKKAFSVSAGPGLAQNFKVASRSVEALRSEIAKTAKGTNALGNNAYQIGQAFEDAAIGFQLNGVQGALRGASNNVAFLIQNLSQAGTLTSTLGARAAELLPLYFGIGTAVAFIVPSLVRWVRGLEEVEDKSKEIADLMQREFTDIKFRVSLVLDERGVLKSLREAKDATEAIATVLRIAEQSDELTVKINAEVDELSTSELSKKFGVAMDQVGAALKKRGSFLQDQIDTFGPAGAGDGLPEPESQKKIRAAAEANKEVAKSFKIVDDARRQAFENSKEGITDPAVFGPAVKSLQVVIDKYKDVIASNAMTEEQTNEATASLKGFQDVLRDVLEDSQKLQSLNDTLFNKKIEISTDNAEKLSRELQFQQQILKGQATEEERILFIQREERLEREKKNKEMLKANANGALAVKLAKAANNELRLKQEVELTKEIADVQKEIADLSKKRKKDSDDSSQQRQLGDPGAIVLGVLGDELDPNIEEMKRLQDELAKLTEALKNLGKGPPTGEGRIRQDFAPEEDFNFGGAPARGALLERGGFENPEAEAIFLEEKERRRKEFNQRIDNERILQVAKEGAAAMERETAKKKAEAAAKEIEEQKKAAEAEKEAIRKQVEAMEKPAGVAPNLLMSQRQIDEAQKIQEDNARKEGELAEQFARERERKRAIDEENERMGRTPQQIENLRRASEGFESPQSRFAPSFAPEDIPSQINAQAQANSRAMENTDFTSTTLQSLIATSNEILGRLNENVTKIDTTARYL